MPGKLILNGKLYGGGVCLEDIILSGSEIPDNNIGENGTLYIKYNQEETIIENIYFKINGVWITTASEEAQ